MKRKSQVSSLKSQIPRSIFFCVSLGLGIWNLELGTSFAQSAKIDSIKRALQTEKNDTVQATLVNELSRQLTYTGDYNQAWDYACQAKTLADKVHHKKEMSKALNNIAVIYYYRGNYPAALKNHFEALKLREEINDKRGIASSHNNIGVVYEHQGNYSEALKNYFSVLKIFNQLDNRNGIAMSYNNIGNVYFYKGDHAEALKNYTASLKINEEMQDKNSIAMSYNNIGLVYDELKNYREALNAYNISLKIREEIGDKEGVATSYVNLGALYLKTKQLNLSTECLTKAVELSMDIWSIDVLKDAYSGFAQTDSAMNNYKQALEHYKMFIIYRDSLLNEENTKKTVQVQMQYEFDKKEAAAKAESDKQAAVAEAEKKKQQVILYSVIGGLLIVLVFAGFIFRALRITQKQKKLIEQQKKIVEEKQKEILDSIHYAKRIQTALLPTEKYIDKTLKRLMKK